MRYIESILIILGIFFIFLGILNYLKVLKKLKYFYKIIKTSRIRYICIIIFMIVFIVLYLLALKSVLLEGVGNDKFTLIISTLLFMGGGFVYVVILLLRKIYFSIEFYHMEMVKSLVKVVELRDEYTKGHSEDVASLVELIFNHLPVNLKVGLSKNDLIQAALLHDIGKILVPDNVLNKKGSLTGLEYEIMKKHADDGSNVLGSFEVFQNMALWVKYHHERIDGSGYYGLKKENIPLESKIIAVADTYSALTTNRIYRSKMSSSKAIKILKEVSGTQLDSEIVEVLVRVIEKKAKPLKSTYLPKKNKNSKILIIK